MRDDVFRDNAAHLGGGAQLVLLDMPVQPILGHVGDRIRLRLWRLVGLEAGFDPPYDFARLLPGIGDGELGGAADLDPTSVCYGSRTMAV